MTTDFMYGLIGAISGLHSSCWGAYKDCLYEEFKLSKFLRSIVVGFALGILLKRFLGMDNCHSGMFFAFVMACERLFTESFKAFAREEKQDKYRIPSKFHVFGRIVENKLLRSMTGSIFVVTLLLLFSMPTVLQINLQPSILNGLIWGTMGGLMGAVGGAWKDAPIEGFCVAKFLRSPLVAGIWGGIFSLCSSDYFFLLVACIGAERMTIELYKAFITRQRPGKFRATKPIYRNWVQKRRGFLIPYIFTWIMFIILCCGSDQIRL